MRRRSRRLCLAAGVGGCFVIQGSYGPEPFVLGDEEIEAGCVSFADDQPPTTLSLKAFPAEAIANLKDNNKKEAKKVLEKLISSTEDSSAINSKAKELIEKL